MTIPFTNRTWDGLWRRAGRLFRKHLLLPLFRVTRDEASICEDGTCLTVDLHDRYISSLLFVNRNYEPEIQEVLKSMDLNSAISVDIGANLGIHTVLLSKLAGIGGRVFAFEPDARNFALLERNLRNNGCSNVVARRFALGSLPGTCRMTRHPSSFGDHHVEVAPSRTDDGDTEVQSLDNILSGLPAGSIRLIKVDAEGYEADVLDGMRDVLRSNPDVVLILEIWPEGLRRYGRSAARMLNELLALGFDGWEVTDNRITSVARPWAYSIIPDYVNVVLCRNPRILGMALPLRYQKRMEIYS